MMLFNIFVAALLCIFCNVTNSANQRRSVQSPMMYHIAILGAAEGASRPGSRAMLRLAFDFLNDGAGVSKGSIQLRPIYLFDGANEHSENGNTDENFAGGNSITADGDYLEDNEFKSRSLKSKSNAIAMFDAASIRKQLCAAVGNELEDSGSIIALLVIGGGFWRRVDIAEVLNRFDIPLAIIVGSTSSPLSWNFNFRQVQQSAVEASLSRRSRIYDAELDLVSPIFRFVLMRGNSWLTFVYVTDSAAGLRRYERLNDALAITSPSVARYRSYLMLGDGAVADLPFHYTRLLRTEDSAFVDKFIFDLATPKAYDMLLVEMRDLGMLADPYEFYIVSHVVAEIDTAGLEKGGVALYGFTSTPPAIVDTTDNDVETARTSSFYRTVQRLWHRQPSPVIDEEATTEKCDPVVTTSRSVEEKISAYSPNPRCGAQKFSSKQENEEPLPVIPISEALLFDAVFYIRAMLEEHLQQKFQQSSRSRLFHQGGLILSPPATSASASSILPATLPLKTLCNDNAWSDFKIQKQMVNNASALSKQQLQKPPLCQPRPGSNLASCQPSMAATSIESAVVAADGLTGWLIFDEKSGHRTGYTLTLLETSVDRPLSSTSTTVDAPTAAELALEEEEENGLVEEEEESDTIATEDEGTGDLGTANYFPFMGTGTITLNVTSILSPPFLLLRNRTGAAAFTPAPPGHKDQKGSEESQSAVINSNEFEGFCVDLAEEIGRVLKIRFYFRLVRDHSYGAQDPVTKRWNGMLGELIRGDAHVAVAPLTITSQRERVVQMTKPFINTGVSIMIKKPERQQPGVFSFMEPLSSAIWVCVLFAYCGTAVCMWILCRLDADKPMEAPFRNAFWSSLCALLGLGGEFSPRSPSGRLLATVWWFFCLILISSYTANMTAFLTVERLVTPIESAEDLVRQDRIGYGTLDSGSTKDFFAKSENWLYQRMWQVMNESVPSVFVSSTEAGVERVRNSGGRYAFLLESTMNAYYNQRTPCNTMQVGSLLDSKGYGIVTPLGSKWHDHLNYAVLHLKETGVVQQLVTKWWYDKGECSVDSSTKQDISGALRLNQVAGVFYILLSGLAIGTLLSSVEFSAAAVGLSKRAQLGFSLAARTLLSGCVLGAASRTIRPARDDDQADLARRVLPWVQKEEDKAEEAAAQLPSVFLPPQTRPAWLLGNSGGVGSGTGISLYDLLTSTSNPPMPEGCCFFPAPPMNLLAVNPQPKESVMSDNSGQQLPYGWVDPSGSCYALASKSSTMVPLGDLPMPPRYQQNYENDSNRFLLPPFVPSPASTRRIIFSAASSRQWRSVGEQNVGSGVEIGDCWEAPSRLGDRQMFGFDLNDETDENALEALRRRYHSQQ